MFNMYIVWYLFLAGAGSGAYVVAALFSLFGRYTTRDDLREYRIISRGGFWLGPLLVAFGVLFLVFDLSRPELAFTLFTTPKLSILNFGAWALLLFCALACALLFAHNAKQVYVPSALLRFAEVVSLLAAFSVMVYTGVLVSGIPAVPFLHSPMIVVIFAISSLSSGAAVITLYGFFNQHRKSMRYGLKLIPHIDLALIILEAISLVVFFVLKYFEAGVAGESLEMLLIGENAAVFWVGVVFLGMVVPETFGIVSRRTAQPLSAANWAICATALLVSALALRYCLLASGLHLSI